MGWDGGDVGLAYADFGGRYKTMGNLEAWGMLAVWNESLCWVSSVFGVVCDAFLLYGSRVEMCLLLGCLEGSGGPSSADEVKGDCTVGHLERSNDVGGEVYGVCYVLRGRLML